MSPSDDVSTIDLHVRGVLELQPGGWVGLSLPQLTALLGTNQARLIGTIDGVAFAATCVPRRSGTHMLALSSVLRGRGKRPGDTVDVHVTMLRTKPTTRRVA